MAARNRLAGQDNSADANAADTRRRHLEVGESPPGQKTNAQSICRPMFDRPLLRGVVLGGVVGAHTHLHPTRRDSLPRFSMPARRRPRGGGSIFDSA